ncbi:MAG: aminoacyl-tRNA hydrolase [Anaerolineaceae bacterium]|nr:aminoacyl-tRNA hydrolase [Anaerolineaceae bacterium]
MFSFLRKKDTEMLEKRIFLVAGLGNPGREYKQTRHNIGFMVAEQLSGDVSVPMGKVQARAIIGIGKYSDAKIILARPQTYMNRSGESVKSLLNYYKIPIDQLIVIHDDLDIPFGAIRIRKQGGPGGQKGIKSIIDHLGTQDFVRLRMGIDRPPGRMDAADYVLQRFSRAEEEHLSQFITQASLAVQSILNDGVDQAMNEYNGQAV